MKASLSTIKYISGEYGGTERDLLEIGVDELKKLATNRLGGLEGIEEYGRQFDGALVAKVISCEKHPDADKLQVCMIDAGEAHQELRSEGSELIQVVCGAPNARAGLTVVWLPPGTTVPSSRATSEPFILGKREIRGVVSNGMLASPSELGLYDNHDGILEIDVDDVGEELSSPGTEFKKLYGLDDVLLDFENKMFTHRPDCFGQIGLARELAAIQGMKYEDPEWYWQLPSFQNDFEHAPSVGLGVGDKVPRLIAVEMGDVKVGESPVWLKSFITRMGGKPVNNVVDITNYLMHLTGQPTHAYDLAKLRMAGKHATDASVDISARYAKKGEPIALLNGKSIELDEEDIVISTGNHAVGIAGIMGGSETEVDENSTEILLEVGTFDMYTIRKTAMKYGLFTDAFTRFSKGQSPLQNDRVMAKLMGMLGELVGAKQTSMVNDFMDDSMQKAYDRQSVHGEVKLTVDFVNSRLGTNLSFDEIAEILRRVHMAVVQEGDEFAVTAPYWRTDIELPEDVVEEVGRLYGFDQLELKLPTRSTRPVPKNILNEYKTNLRDALSSAGANEVLSYSFVHGDVLKKLGVNDPDKRCYHLRNAISPDLQYYRPALMPSLVTKVQQNIRSDMVRPDDNEFALYEIGKVHVRGHESIDPDTVDPRSDKQALPDEMERLALIFAADDKTAGRKYHGSALYMAKHYLLPLVNGPVEFAPLEPGEYPITAPYDKNRSATVSINGQVLGVVGEFRSEVKKAFKLPDYCAGFELDLTLLKGNTEPESYSTIGTYPKVQQDITLSVDVKVSFALLLSTLKDQLTRETTDHGYVWRIAPRNIYQPEGSGKVSYTFRIWLWHPDKTLKTEEANSLNDRLAEAAKKSLNAERS